MTPGPRGIAAFTSALMRIWNPPLFQGSFRKQGYFEGWYFKQVSKDGRRQYSFIPGVSLGSRNGDFHAFVQVIRGDTGQTWYYSYPMEDFDPPTETFSSRVGPFRFSEAGLSGTLGNASLGEETFSLDLRFSPFCGYQSAFLRPGVMGPFRFVPFMECYHGLVSMNHGLSGTVTQGSEPVSFEGGRGYAEKDWGSSMPSSWVWIQCNSFERPDVSFMFSLATIPWLGSSFPGFLGVLAIGTRILTFATYGRTKINELTIGTGACRCSLEDRQGRLTFEARSVRVGELKAPVKGSMLRSIGECVDSTVTLRWEGRDGEIFEGIGHPAGFESVGDSAELLRVLRNGRAGEH